MNVQRLLVAAGLACASTGLGAPIVYDFRDVPAGPLPGGFLSLTVDDVNAFFGANGTTVDVDPATGTHVLRTGSFRGQLGIEFSSPVRQIVIGLAGDQPSTTAFVSASGYYGADYGIHPMPRIKQVGSSLTLNLPRGIPETRGILLDFGSTGEFSIEQVAIQLIPEPSTTALLVAGGVGIGALSIRMRRR